jgi:RNA polymerase sigma factor (sigma-70 family)
MIDSNESLCVEIRSVAEQMILRYARGIISVEELVELIALEWETRRIGTDRLPHAVLVRIAQRICSRTLYTAWRSSNIHLRDCAFDNLRNYLEFSLLHCGYAPTLQSSGNATEDVLHLTLEELIRILQRNGSGPDDPAAFLKWSRTILIRQAHVYLQKYKSEPWLSLDAQKEIYTEQFVDTHEKAPHDYAEDRELQQALKDAILSLRNSRYRQVLLYTFLGGMDESELAAKLHVQVQDVYMWRHRALKALRENAELMQQLRSLRE